ncbi:hypothetical protein BS78_07G214700 [Paspalum vaginatum]|nr:hypothetical protein BS78_07G214700 [Paspalum vaginatum]
MHGALPCRFLGAPTRRFLRAAGFLTLRATSLHGAPPRRFHLAVDLHGSVLRCMLATGCLVLRVAGHTLSICHVGGGRGGGDRSEVEDRGTKVIPPPVLYQNLGLMSAMSTSKDP